MTFKKNDEILNKLLNKLISFQYGESGFIEAMQFDNLTKLFDAIQHAFKKGQYRLTIHCLERCIERSVEVEDIECAIEGGEIIEYYPEDKYGPSCLILGYTTKYRPLHIQCSINPVWIVTCYDPSEKKGKWSKDFRRRIKS